MRDLNTFAFGREQHCVIPDNISGPNGFKADLFCRTSTGLPLTTIYGTGLQITSERISNDFSHPQSGTGRRINLMSMVRFDHFNIVATVITQCLGSNLKQLKAKVTPTLMLGANTSAVFSAACFSSSF